MSYQDLIYEVRDDHIAIITFNRPQVMNALSGKTHQELKDAIAEANADPEVRVIVLTGAGRGFCSGDDVNAIFLESTAAGTTEERTNRGRAQQLNYLEGGKVEGGGAALQGQIGGC